MRRGITAIDILTYFSLVSVYLILAAVLIAGANGYILNRRTWRFEQTGTIILATKQTPAAVRVNTTKEHVAKRSPVKLTYLLPGWYSVSVTKAGFVPWRKTFFLQPGQVIVESSVKLFSTISQPAPVSAENRKIWDRTMALQQFSDLDIRGSEIWVKPVIRSYPFIGIGDNFALVSRFSQPVQNARWTPDNAHIVFQLGKELRVIDRDGGNDLVLATLATSDAVAFGVTSDYQYLLFQDQGQIWQRGL